MIKTLVEKDVGADLLLYDPDLDGEIDWMISRKMHTEQMSCFLSQISTAHPEEFIAMVLDGASS
jgi:hypothetical protein